MKKVCEKCHRSGSNWTFKGTHMIGEDVWKEYYDCICGHTIAVTDTFKGKTNAEKFPYKSEAFWEDEDFKKTPKITKDNTKSEYRSWDKDIEQEILRICEDLGVLFDTSLGGGDLEFYKDASATEPLIVYPGDKVPNDIQIRADIQEALANFTNIGKVLVYKGDGTIEFKDIEG